MPKRNDEVAPPAAGDDWSVRYLDSAAVQGWTSLGREAPGATKTCWEVLRSSPDRSVNLNRHHRLKGTLGERVIQGRVMEQWQYEVTGAGRVWYCIDPDKKIVWLSHASPGHPKATE